MSVRMIIRVLKRLDVGINVFQRGDVIEMHEAEDDWGLTEEKLDALEKLGIIRYEDLC